MTPQSGFGLRVKFLEKNYQGFPRCARLGTSPRHGQSPLASTLRTPALRSDDSRCHNAAKRQHKGVKKINIRELQLLPHRTVCRVKFCLHAAEACAQEEIFLKSSKSIFLFSLNAREPVLKLLLAATVPDWEPKK